MKCPVCTEADLVMSERQGIEIDYCPKCRGVWLDRGELDKIIERAAGDDHRDDDDDDDDRRRRAAGSGVAPSPGHIPPPGYPGYGSHPQSHPHAPPPPPPQQYGHGHYGHYKKRKSFWSELFDD